MDAARDVIQNHLLQLLALTAMERSVSFTPDALQTEKERILSAVRLPSDLQRSTARGQYSAGWQGGNGCAATQKSTASPRDERLILDVLVGDPPLFPGQREVELSWNTFDPRHGLLGATGAALTGRGRGVLARPTPRWPMTAGPGGCRESEGADEQVIAPLDATTSGEVAARLVALREEGGAIALGRVLTLVVLTRDGDCAERAFSAANAASHEHPCRVIVVVPGSHDAEATMSAEIRVGADAGASEVILLRPRGKASAHLDTIVILLLLPDVPITAWWTNDPPAVRGEDPIGAMAQRSITDALSAEDPYTAIRSLAHG